MIRPHAMTFAGSILVLATAMPLVAQSPNSVFNPLPPCRVVDSRSNLGTSGTLLPGQIRNITFRGKCGIPSLTTDGGLESNIAVAIAVNVVAANPAGPGHLAAWPSNRPQPTAAIINYTTAHIANGVILPMCDQLEVDPPTPCSGGDIQFQAAVSSTDLVIDVTGYYVKPTLSGAKRHGTGSGADASLCLGSDNHFGLSDKLVTFAKAPLACPTGTHICSSVVVTGNPCNTSRVDSACDFRTCDGTCIDLQPNDHFGWSRSASNPFQDRATSISENGVAIAVPTCEYYPVWCCSVG